MNRFERRQEAKNRILRAIIEGDKTRPELLKVSGVSNATLSKRLDEIMEDGKIEAYVDPQDRRVTFYRIKEQNRQNVENELTRYRFERFLKLLDAPFFCVEKTDKKDNFQISASLVAELEEESRYMVPELQNRVTPDVLNRSLAGLSWLFRTLIRHAPKEGQRAISKWVFMVTAEKAKS